jgi:hypothetical protein
VKGVFKSNFHYIVRVRASSSMKASVDCSELKGGGLFSTPIVVISDRVRD